MKILLYIYGVVYALFTTWTIVDNVKSKDPWWDKASDGILLPLGGIGIALFLFEVNYPSLKSIWKVVCIFVVAGQAASNVFARHLALNCKTEAEPEEMPQWAILGADLTTVILLAPMFVINLMYAFSS